MEIKRYRVWGILAGVVAVAAIILVADQSERNECMAGQTETAAAGGGNRLQFEKSPYLLQHQDNPVDWYPWGEEAFAAAQREDKPIFLSIGYSTCHWCHVMEHESFEDPEVAVLMNDAFISIKVDREERPDIDNIYMAVCQMMTKGGGWPLTILMTPDKKPFFAGTYFPKESRSGRMGMLELIPRIKQTWENDREKIYTSANQITNALAESSVTKPSAGPGAGAVQTAYKQLTSRYDATYGGFGSQPKFPTPHNLLFLLREYHSSGDLMALQMVRKTLDRMRRGGIYDHIGFGFHRYSTDRQWLLPHFEKMLYDQALLAMAYTETYQVTGEEDYARTAQEIFTYTLRDMTAPEGGFYSAEDADSEGEEGKFYVWSVDEVRAILGDDAGLFIKVFNLEVRGNFAEQSTGRVTGHNIPHLQKPVTELAAGEKTSEAELRRRLVNMRQKMFAVREKRVHPHKDDKILTDWNGLMIAALAKGAQAFDKPEYAQAARRAADFILGNMRTGDNRLLHRFREGQAAISGNCDDYAFLIWGLLELYEATFDVRYLEHARGLNKDMVKYFWDDQSGGFYFTADDAEDLIVRQKEIYDGAVPSGNSVAMLNLLRLGRITADPEYEKKAESLGRAFGSDVGRMPSAHSLLMVAVNFALGPTHEVVIVGNPESTDTKEMLRSLRRQFLPNKVVLFRPDGDEDNGLVKLAEFTRYHTSIDGKATAYVCRNYACELPTTEVDKMLKLLKGDKSS